MTFKANALHQALPRVSFPAHQVPQVFSLPNSELALVSARRFCPDQLPRVFGLSALDSQGGQ